MKNYLLLSLCLLVLMPRAEAQTGNNRNLLNGFARKVDGVDFSYHSSIPVARECMLIRATDGTSSMEWVTAPAAFDKSNENATFVWLAGIGSSPGLASFDLFIDGMKEFTFWADGKDSWSITAQSGCRLSFKSDMVDQYGDRFGFMSLSLPAGRLVLGKPLNIKVTGGRFSKTSWYMTFKLPLESGVTLKALPAISRLGEKSYQLGTAGILHFGNPTRAILKVGGKKVCDTTVIYGYNYIRINLPRVSKKTRLTYRLDLDGKSWKGEVELKPVKEWQVNFVQHSHTDIGYTRPQTDILAEHLRFIDYALDYCDLTDDYPVEAQFRWTCEASWAVDEYLKCRPEAQIERLRKRVEEGRIEITGMYFNFDELPDEQTLAASLKAIGNIRSHGMKVETAMQNDVNGIGWCLNDYFSQAGIRYLNMGTHGHRALICFDKPTLFCWESPAGNRMLVFRAEHYMTGNTVFKIHAGNFEVFEDELLTYLADLETKGYPYSVISIQHSGYITDNSPPSTQASEMIRQWNEKYAWPKLRTATATDFFKTMEASGDTFPVIRGAWPDWWTDGFGASAREVAATRYAQTDLIASAAGLTMAAIAGIKLPGGINDRIDEVNNALLFYTEHTVGYHGSVREPLHFSTMEQRALKESYAWEAGRRSKMIGEETMGLLQSVLPRNALPSLVVYNTLSWNRSGIVKIYIDHQIIPRYTSFSITDANGKRALAQAVENHSDGTYWAIWVDDIPAFGYKQYMISTEKQVNSVIRAEEHKACSILENQWYTVYLDTLKGTITRIYDKELKRELLDSTALYKAGSFIYEELDNRQQMESFRLDNYTRKLPDSAWFESFTRGDLWDAVRFKANTNAATGDGALVIEYRLYHVTKRIELLYDIEKKAVTDPEGIYIALPFQLSNGKLYFDVQGGEVQAGVDQIPGSSNDWNTVQNYARLASPDAQILVASREAPLMQFGGINTGRYKAGALPASTHIYGWPMNNYWTTNFNADQRGGHRWSYVVSSTLKTNSVEAIQYGWGIRVPFCARVLPGGGTENYLKQGAFLSGWPENLLLIIAVPEVEGKSAILQVREVGGKATAPQFQNGLNGKTLRMERVDVTGNPLSVAGNTLKPLESAFFRVWF
jgi:alpha-mannosidase